MTRLRALVRTEPLRTACAAAGVPLLNAPHSPIDDKQLLSAVRVAREGASLAAATTGLEAEVRAGRLKLRSRVLDGPITWCELVLLASVLRSHVADSVAT